MTARDVVSDTTGVLLAGGRSRRMGRDKRFLQVGEATLLERALQVYEHLFEEILIVVAEVTAELGRLRHQVLADLVPNSGSLGGLYTGLAAASGGRIFVAACDMPFLNKALIRQLCAADEHADVIMPQLATGVQPMHAVYSKACLPHLQQMVASRRLRLQDMTKNPALRFRLVPEDELRQFDPLLLSFLNLNTPADLVFARKLAIEQLKT